jgi:hypothetical protein
MSRYPSIPAIPADATPQQRAWMQAVTQALQSGTGAVRGADRFLRISDVGTTLLSADTATSTSPASSTATGPIPNPPSNLAVASTVYGARLTWDYPENGLDEVSHIEVWTHNANALTSAARVAIVTKPVAEFRDIWDAPYADHYYWIRCVSYGGKYSAWVPREEMGGMLVTAQASISAKIDEAMDILQGNLTEDQLVQDLAAEINLISAPETVEQSVNARLAEEARIRSEALAAEAETRELGITQEQTTRQTETERLDRDLYIMRSAVDNAQAMVLTEAEARATGDVANATLLTTLQASIDSTTSVLTEEQGVRAEADKALAYRLDSLVLAAGDGIVEIDSEIAARIAGDDALASSIQTLDTRMGDAESSIEQEQTARTTSLESVARDLYIARTSIGNAQGLIQKESAIRADEDQVVIDMVNTVDAKVDTTAALLTEDIQVAATKADASARYARTLKAETEATTAAIQQDLVTQTGPESALAKSVETVQTTVGENTASIEDAATAIDGIKAERTMKVQVRDADGKLVLAGIGMIADGETEQSEIVLMANELRIVQPDGTGALRQPFTVGMVDGESLVGIDGTMMIDGSLLAKAISTDHAFIGHTLQSTDYDPEAGAGYKIDGQSGEANFYNMRFRIMDGAAAADVRSDLNVADGATDDSGIYFPGTTEVDGGKIRTRTVSADKIESNSLTASQIAAKAVTADKINVTSLSAINANIGIATAGRLQNSANTNYINLNAAGTSSFLRVGNNVDIRADGSGTFARTLISAPRVVASGIREGLSIDNYGSTLIYTGIKAPQTTWGSPQYSSYIARAGVKAAYQDSWPSSGYYKWWYLRTVVYFLSGIGHSGVVTSREGEIYIKVYVDGPNSQYGCDHNVTKIWWSLLEV